MAKFIETNLWKDTCQNAQSYPKLDQDIDVDFAIIGGGFTGLSAALRLCENNQSVAVLEAQDIGYGGSGRNVGLVNAGLWLKPNEITDKIGQKYGERLIHFLSEAPNKVFENIEKYQIPCEAKHIGTLHCAEDDKGCDDLLQRQEQWAKYGVNLNLLDHDQTSTLLGTKAYRAALHDLRAGTIQPLSYACGLALNAAKLGAHIFCQSPVQSVLRDDGKWTLRTAQGAVRAKNIISATGTYNQNEYDNQGPDTTSLYYFQMATQPLKEDLLKSILPQKHSMWDAKQVLTSFRLNDEGRLIIGSIGNLDNITYTAHKSWAYRKMAEVYPQLKGETFDHEWYGRIGLTNDNIPRIAAPHPNWLTMWGYNGRGIAPGTAFGRLLADIHLGRRNESLPLEFSEIKTEQFIALQSFGIDLGASLYHSATARF
ncbi:MAG: FAD-binding oxidoreductase [Methylocystaceae bacterium]|nr:FAD-binding oxidoreductase [Methylocystaceae bacterium]